MKIILVAAGFMLLALYSVDGQTCTEVENCDSCENKGPVCSGCGAAKVLSADEKTCIDCGTNCAECHLDGDTTHCDKCSKGRLLEDGTCESCTLENCLTCVMEGETEMCTKCEGEGYTLSGGACVGCPTGKYEDGGNCKSCPSNAVSCTSGPTVTECKDDGVKYVKSEDASSCKPCTGCAKCALDGTEAKCTECAPNKYLNADACSYCTDDDTGKKCATCEDGGKCSECNTKYRVVGDACQDCPSNCDECSEHPDGDDDVCDVCSVEYGLTSGQSYCEACSSNCLECTKVACTLCAVGYDLVSTGACKPCPSKCTACDYPSPTSALADVPCSDCEANAGLVLADNSNGVDQCFAKAVGCVDYNSTNDYSSGDSVLCTSCSTGYYLNDVDATCPKCDTAVDHCKVCNDTAYCTECNNGYVAVNGECSGCGVDNCADCTTNITYCDQCLPGYVVSADKYTCLACDNKDINGVENCVTCNAHASTSTVDGCTGCDSGYTLNGGECVKCTTGCNQCSQDGTCISGHCKPGYRPQYSDGTENGKCTKCNENCDVCNSKAEDNTQQCTTCAAKYVLVSAACQACPENCEKCSESDGTITCDNNECSDGYGKTAEGTCTACIENCKQCDADDDGNHPCETCSEKYGANDDQCVKCPSNCVKCSISNGVMVCDECKATYVVNAGKCDKCPSNCNECPSATKCNKGKCNSGYAVNDQGECQDCVGLTGLANCATCSEKTDANSSAPCKSCSGSFTLKDGLESGEGAECIPTNELSCKGSPIVDKPAECAEDSCTGITELGPDKKCGLVCHVCGDLANDVFVAKGACSLENGTATYAFCPSGYCEMKTREVDGEENQIAGGCMAPWTTCEDPGKKGECTNTVVDGKEIEDCPHCCNDEHLCTEQPLRDADAGSHAVSTSMSLLMLSSCSITVLTMLLQHISY